MLLLPTNGNSLRCTTGYLLCSRVSKGQNFAILMVADCGWVCPSMPCFVYMKLDRSLEMDAGFHPFSYLRENIKT